MNRMLQPPPQLGLELMLAEFESHQLEVMLVPQKVRTNEGGCIRVAVSKNCNWYRAFCARHLSSRERRNCAPDTRIKRRNVEKALTALLVGRRTSKYDEEFLRIAVRLAAPHSAA